MFQSNPDHSFIVMKLFLKVHNIIIIYDIDLPNLKTISFKGGSALQGDNKNNRIAIINGHESYNNWLIMKSKLK